MQRRFVLALSLCMSVVAPFAAQAQQWSPRLSSDDLTGSAQDLLGRAPDGSIDSLFQVFHDAMRQPQEASAICSLFAPDADRGINGLTALAQQLSPGSRDRLGAALADIVVGGLQGQGQGQPYDRGAAERALTANVTRAALLNDGFGAGLAADASSDARCHTLRAMLDVLGQRPQAERAQVTRFLLEQGLRSATR